MRRLRALALLCSAAGLLLIAESFAAERVHASPLGRDHPIAEVSQGSLIATRLDSSLIGSRNVAVWLPPGFDRRTPYDVLFMHDGQMLFDSTVTWNSQEWGVDEVISSLLARERISPLVVVAIDNAGDRRRAEYFPQSAASYVPDSVTRTPDWFTDLGADAYVTFLVTELRTWLFETHRLKATGDNSFLMGSSMGGLISMYAMTQAPEHFVGAACVSTHWPGDVPVPPEGEAYLAQAIQAYFRDALPTAGRHRWYFDFGTETLDQHYEAWQREADEHLTEKGYRQPVDWLTLKFEGANHSEDAWRERLHRPLEFLFEPTSDRHN